MTLSNICATTTGISPYLYTGKERDAESGNDYFEARYYSSAIGRFMSPDWSVKAEPVPYAKLENPQSLNLYAYLRNNPLAGVDADGHEPPQPPPPTLQQLQPLLQNIESKVCSATPTAGVQGVSGTGGGIGGATGSLELVTNYRTGDVSGFRAGGMSLGWNGGATGSVFSGAIWGLNGDNSNYKGGFTSATASGSIPVPFVGVQGTFSGSSKGLTPTLQSPMPDGKVKSATVGVNVSTNPFKYSWGAAATNYAAATQLGRYWTLGNPQNFSLFVANQMCAATGH